MLDNYSEIMTVQDVQDVLMIGKNTVYSLLLSNNIEGFKIGRTYKIKKESLKNYIRRSAQLSR